MGNNSLKKEEILFFLKNFKDLELLESLANKLSLHVNYTESTWKNKDFSLYKEIETISHNIGYDWKSTRVLITSSVILLHSKEYKRYLEFLENKSPKTLRLFLDTLAGDTKKKAIVKISNKVDAFYPEIKSFLSEMTDKECNSIDEQYFALRQSDQLLPKCKYCGKVIHIVNSCINIPTICNSKECRSQNMKDITSSFSKEKIEEINKRRKKTCISIYGTNTPSQNEEVKEKTRQTNLGRYGTEWTCQAESVKSKIQRTFLKNYGTTSPMKNEEVKKKMKDTCIERYGVDNIKKSPRIKEIFLEKYGVENNNLIGKDPYSIEIYKSPEKLKAYFDANKGKTLKEISDSLGFSSYQIGRILHTYGLDKYVGETIGTSIGEKSLISFISDLIGEKNIIVRDRQTICPLELDILIPSKKIALEYNGNFWHSDAILNSRRDRDNTRLDVKRYHLRKTELCKEKGIRLIHIFEYEWQDNTKRERLKKFLTDTLLPEKRINLYARKCTLKELSSEECKRFLEENHLQGKDTSSIKLGLFFEDMLIACMTFCKPRFSKKYNWELSRFVVKSGYSVVGAGGKLLSYFKKHFQGSIISYSDISKMTGNLYRSLGFQELKPSEPNYVWIKGETVLTRYQTQKHKLLEKGLLGETEESIMREQGFSKLYDCGNYVFLME